MNKIRAWLPFVLLAGLGLIPTVSDPAPPLAGDSGRDLVQTVEVFAARGVLKVHGRNETQYRDMAAGSQSLTSGSFLKTAGGQADILLPDNSILSLDVNTEVQLGMYENGTRVGQQSGQAWHFVEPREDAGYAVRTRFYTATALGTEYLTRVNWPAEGAVTVFWGEVGVMAEVRYPPETEENTHFVYEFVPDGYKTIWPADPAASGRLRAGDHETFHAEQGKSVGQRGSVPPQNSWSSRNRTRGQIIRELGRWRRAGRMSPADYRQKLGALLGIGPEVIPNEPLGVQGGLYVGMNESGLINFCLDGNHMNTFRFYGGISCRDKQTGRGYSYMVDYSIDEAGLVYTEPTGVIHGFQITGQGLINGMYTFEQGVYQGLYVVLSGWVRGSSGRITLIMGFENDVAICYPPSITVELKRSPAPCVR